MIERSFEFQRRVTRILTIANVVVVLAIALLLLAIAALGWPLTILPDDLPTAWRIFLGVVAVAVIALDLTFIYYRFFSGHDRFLAVKTGEGIVQVAIAALEQSLARIARELPEVHDARVRILTGRPAEATPLIVRVNYAAWEGGSIPDFSQKIQKALQMRLEQICGADIVARYQVYLTRIDVRQLRKPSSRAEASREEPVDLFRGPVYPTGDEY